MLDSMIIDMSQPKPNTYFIEKVREVLVLPCQRVIEAWQSCQKPHESQKPTMGQPIPASEVFAHMERMEELKNGGFFAAEEKDGIDLSFMAAAESWNAERVEQLRSYVPEASISEADINFG